MERNPVFIQTKLFEYIAQHTVHDISDINPQTPLFKEGVFDSMGFILLIDFLEENFEIKTSDNDLIESNFETIASITEFVNKKLKS
jgi:acyl carrier protein